MRTRRDAHPAPERGEELEGSYTRERLLEMDAQFVERVERAINDGREQRAGSEAHAARARRQ